MWLPSACHSNWRFRLKAIWDEKSLRLPLDKSILWQTKRRGKNDTAHGNVPMLINRDSKCKSKRLTRFKLSTSKPHLSWSHAEFKYKTQQQYLPCAPLKWRRENDAKQSTSKMAKFPHKVIQIVSKNRWQKLRAAKKIAWTCFDVNDRAGNSSTQRPLPPSP